MADKPDVLDAPPSDLQGPSTERTSIEGEPPVVARLVVEIRSDGSRTIARGAIEDVTSSQRTTIEARGDSPIQLAIALARALTQLPRLGARSAAPPTLASAPRPYGVLAAVRGLLGRKRDR
jgi:hypothetical protein